MRRARFGLLLVLIGAPSCFPEPVTPGAEAREGDAPIVVPETMVVPALTPAKGAPDASSPFRPGQIWRGTYVCPQGTTNLDLIVADVAGRRVRAIFDFDHPPSGARGAFVMDGRVDEAGHAGFTAGDWIARPPNYVTVGMEGDVSDSGMRFSGRISEEVCGAFDLRLVRH